MKGNATSDFPRVRVRGNLRDRTILHDIPVSESIVVKGMKSSVPRSRIDRRIKSRYYKQLGAQKDVFDAK